MRAPWAWLLPAATAAGEPDPPVVAPETLAPPRPDAESRAWPDGALERMEEIAARAPSPAAMPPRPLWTPPPAAPPVPQDVCVGLCNGDRCGACQTLADEITDAKTARYHERIADLETQVAALAAQGQIIRRRSR